MADNTNRNGNPFRRAVRGQRGIEEAAQNRVANAQNSRSPEDARKEQREKEQRERQESIKTSVKTLADKLTDFAKDSTDYSDELNHSFKDVQKSFDEIQVKQIPELMFYVKESAAAQRIMARTLGKIADRFVESFGFNTETLGDDYARSFTAYLNYEKANLDRRTANDERDRQLKFESLQEQRKREAEERAYMRWLTDHRNPDNAPPANGNNGNGNNGNNGNNTPDPDEYQEAWADEYETARKDWEDMLNSVATKFIGLLKETLSTIFSWYVDAFKNIQTAYRDNFTSITTRLDLTAHQYSELFQDTARELRDTHLDVQFDSIDYMSELAQNLNLGLRGEIAQRKTMTDLIARKLIPEMQTNSRSFLQGYKLYGDAYTKMVVGMRTLNDTLGKSNEYYEQGLYQTNADNLEMILEGLGYDQTVLSNFHQVMADLTAFSPQLANELSTAINEFIHSGEVNSAFGLVGITTADDLANLFSGPTDELIKKITELATGSGLMGGIRDSDYRLMIGNILQSSGLIAPSIDSAFFADRFLDQEEVFSGGIADLATIFNAYDDKVDNLAKGMYSSETEKMAKRFNNKGIVVDSATYLAEKLPSQIQDLIQKVIAGFASIIGIILFKDPLQSISTSLGSWLNSRFPYSRFVSPNSTGNVGTNVNTGNLGTNGTNAQATPAPGQAASGGLSAVGTGLSIASIVAGAALLGSYGISNAKEVNETGGNATTGTIVTGILSGGASTEGMTLAEKMKRTELDWGAVGKEAGATALIGAGSGALIGGAAGEGVGAAPGALIGAGVGAVVGAASSIITQEIQKYNFQKFGEALDELSDTANNLSKAQTEYSTVVEKSSKVQNYLNVLSSKGTYSEEERQKALDNLQILYPKYLRNIKDLNDVTQDEIDLINEKINKEKSSARTKSGLALDEYSSAIGKALSSAKDALTSDAYIGEYSGVLQKLMEGYENNTMTTEYIDSVLREAAKEAGAVSDNQIESWVEQFNKETGNHFGKDANGKYATWDLANIDDMYGPAGAAQQALINLFGLENDWNKAGFKKDFMHTDEAGNLVYNYDALGINTTKGTVGYDDYDTVRESADTVLSGINELFKIANSYMNMGDRENYAKTVSEINRFAKTYNEGLGYKLGDQISVLDEPYATYKETFKEIAKAKPELFSNAPLPEFSVGTRYVTETMPAILHQGELVANASQFKALVADLTTDIQLRKSEAIQASTVPMLSSETIKETVSIKHQVDDIYVVLTDIRSFLDKLSKTRRFTSPYDEETEW